MNAMLTKVLERNRKASVAADNVSTPNYQSPTFSKVIGRHLSTLRTVWEKERYEIKGYYNNFRPNIDALSYLSPFSLSATLANSFILQTEIFIDHGHSLVRGV